jgi:hypothetical protein
MGRKYRKKQNNRPMNQTKRYGLFFLKFPRNLYFTCTMWPSIMLNVEVNVKKETLSKIPVWWKHRYIPISHMGPVK